MTKRILVTGANKGIGLATVKAILASHNDAYVVLGTRSAARGQAAVDAILSECPDWTQRLHLLQIDVSSEESVLAARDTLVALYPEKTPLFGVVNNAGIGLGSNAMEDVLKVNTFGVQRVCDALLPLVEDAGRVVNVSSASGPNFVSQCSPRQQAFFQDTGLEWPQVTSFIKDVVALQDDPGKLRALGLGDMNAYGFSKACVSLYTLLLARDNPRICINACTPGYIETDLTRPSAEARGVSPSDLGMNSPEQGTVSIMHLLFGTPHGSGHYYGSDGKRSPLDRYRAPGDPEYSGD